MPADKYPCIFHSKWRLLFIYPTKVIERGDFYSVASYRIKLKLLIYKQESKANKHVQNARNSTTAGTVETSLRCTWDRLLSRFLCCQRRADLEPYCNIIVLKRLNKVTEM